MKRRWPSIPNWGLTDLSLLVSKWLRRCVVASFASGIFFSLAAAHPTFPHDLGGAMKKLYPDPLFVARRSAAGNWDVIEKSSRHTHESPTWPVLRFAEQESQDPIIATGQIILSLKDENAWPSLASRYGLTNSQTPAYAPHLKIVSCAPHQLLTTMLALREEAAISSADLVLARQLQTRAIIDTIRDPYFAQAWHIRNKGLSPNQDPFPSLPPIDLNLTTIWGHDPSIDKISGRGIQVAVVDDAVQIDHPDLIERTDRQAQLHFNFAQEGTITSLHDPKPTPGLNQPHGTAVAGIIAASLNKIGTVGVAYESNLVALKVPLGSSFFDDAVEASVHSYLAHASPGKHIHIRNNSWGPADDRFLLTGPGPLARAAIGATALPKINSNSLLTQSIFVWSVGNGGVVGEQANHDGYANNPYIIAVGAADEKGRPAGYSEPGACVAVAGLSDDGQLTNPALRRVTTCDLTGDKGYNPTNNRVMSNELADRNYTNQFTGTSAAAAQVSGVIALMLEVNPALGWREVKEILLRSARRTVDKPWLQNAAGYQFHPRLGAGVVDAEAAVKLAQQYAQKPNQGRKRQMSEDVWTTDRSPTVIPESNPRAQAQALVVPFEINPGTTVETIEHVVLEVDIEHELRSELEIALVSPKGTRSVLSQPYLDPQQRADFPQWRFSSLHFWGEKPPGTWKLEIKDTVSETAGVLKKARLIIMGESFPPPPVINSEANWEVTVGEPLSYFPKINTDPINVYSAPHFTLNSPVDWITLEFDNSRNAKVTINPPYSDQIVTAKLTATNSRGSYEQTLIIKTKSPYQSWIKSLGIPETRQAPEADADADGLSNLEEYTVSLNPILSDSNNPLTQARLFTNQNRLPFIDFNFRMSSDKSDLMVIIERSSDLVKWESVYRRDGPGEFLPTINSAPEIKVINASPNSPYSVSLFEPYDPTRPLYYRWRSRLLNLRQP